MVRNTKGLFPQQYAGTINNNQYVDGDASLIEIFPKWQ